MSEIDFINREIRWHMEKGEYIKALKKSLKLLEKEPNDLNIMYNIGIIHKHLGNIEKAKEINQRILKLNPKDTDALINMAQVSETNGETQKEFEYYNRALQSNLLAIFRNEKLWILALDKFKEDKDILRRIADQCVYNGLSEKLKQLETKTHILGSRTYEIAKLLSFILKKFQINFQSPSILAHFREMHFRLDHVWEQFLKELNLDLGESIYTPDRFIPYDTLNTDVLEKINTLKPGEMEANIISSLKNLVKEGKFKYS